MHQGLAMRWNFTMQNELDVKIGETALVFYEAYNPTNETISGQAGFTSFHSQQEII